MVHAGSVRRTHRGCCEDIATPATVNRMVKHSRAATTSKIGVNFVRSLVEATGYLFHKIDQDSDLGIDALIELVRNELPLNKQVAVQIRSGQAHYEPATEQCLIRVGTHRDYWADYPLPVIGIVYVPSLNRAHWVDLKSGLQANLGASVIRFVSSEANRLDHDTFTDLCLPAWLQETPHIPFHQALALSQSGKRDEVLLGLVVLFRLYPNAKPGKLY